MEAVLDFVAAIGQKRAPASDAPGALTLEGVSIFMKGVGDFCGIAPCLPLDLQDAFVNFAISLVKDNLIMELADERFLEAQAEEQPGAASIDMRLGERINPALGRLP